MIICFSGKRGVGKDTAGNYLIEKYGFQRMSIGDQIRKKILTEFPNIDPKYLCGNEFKEIPFLEGKDFNGLHDRFWSGRQILIDMGKFYKQFDELYWVKQVVSQIKEEIIEDIVITDIRFPNEINCVREYDKSSVFVRMLRDQKLNIYGNKEFNDITETALDSYVGWDYIIGEADNVDMDTLYRKLGSLMIELKK